MTTTGTIATGPSWLLTGQVSQDEPARQIAIESSPFRVGRRNDAALTIPRATVSNTHAEFILEGGTLRVRDLGSTNGTFVNGVRIHNEWHLNQGDLVQFAEVVFRVGQETLADRGQTVSDDSADRALALIQFGQLMVDGAVVPFFQPVVTLDATQTVAYEVLGRSRLFGLNEPRAMFHAAAALNCECELSRMFRLVGVREGNTLPGTPNLFLNTYPMELNEPDLLELSLREVRDIRPSGSTTLEIHEATVTQTERMSRLRALLRDLNIALAYDDFGAGQARFLELAEVPPDVLKFDLKLIQGIDHAPAHRQRLLENLVRMARDLGIVPLAEGIESREEHAICREIGFSLGQGFYYGKPMPAQHYIDGPIREDIEMPVAETDRAADGRAAADCVPQNP